jgi:hypothetical protein
MRLGPMLSTLKRSSTTLGMSRAKSSGSATPLPRLRRCPYLVYHLRNIKICICLLGWSSPLL